MVMIPIKVQGTRKLYPDRQELYRIIGLGADRDLQKFCRILESRLPSNNYGSEDRNAWQGLPWLTLVLGSGCLNLFEDPQAIISTIRRGVSEKLDRTYWDNLLASTEFGQAIRENLLSDLFEDAPGWAAMLVAERLDFNERELLDPGHDPATESVSGFEVTKLAAQFSLFSFLMTRLFFLASSESVVIPARNADQVVALERLQATRNAARAGWGGTSTSALTLELVKSIVSGLRKSTEDDDVLSEVAGKFRAPIHAFLKRISEVLTRGDGNSRLSFSDVRAALDITWLLLAQGSEAYPGWSDLLFSLTCWDDNEGLGRRRPWFTSLALESNFITQLFTEATNASWERHRDSNTPPTLRDKFYDAVAEVLWAQSDLTRMQLAGPGTGGTEAWLPPASAMVASFDMELEFALLRHSLCAIAGRAFYVVVPVHVYFRDEDARDARPYWLRGTIAGGGSRDQSDLPESWSGGLAVERWEVLRDTGSDPTLFDGPHIVRVSGCPLLELPKEQSDPLIVELKAEIGRGQHLLIAPAVTLDEHHAFQQADAEFFFRLSQGKTSEARAKRALPKQLYTSSSEADSSSDVNPRFWMTLGVPVEDPAIRHRLASFLFDRGSWTRGDSEELDPQLTGALAGVGPSHAKVKPGAEISGLVIDKRVSDDDVHLLLWIGFDVVSDSANHFEQDLLHYAAHVRSDEGMVTWRPGGEPCELRETTSGSGEHA